VLVDSIFVNSLMTPWVMEPVWILWGLSFLVATEVRRRSRADMQAHEPTP